MPHQCRQHRRRDAAGNHPAGKLVPHRAKRNALDARPSRGEFGTMPNGVAVAARLSYLLSRTAHLELLAPVARELVDFAEGIILVDLLPLGWLPTSTAQRRRRPSLRISPFQ
jgi:hypothetical protein